jgi:hypothetical protein
LASLYKAATLKELQWRALSALPKVLLHVNLALAFHDLVL